MYHPNKDFNQQNIAKECKIFRNRFNKSQTEVAKQIGISRESLNRFENGKTKLRSKTGWKLISLISLEYQLVHEDRNSYLY